MEVNERLKEQKIMRLNHMNEIISLFIRDFSLCNQIIFGHDEAQILQNDRCKWTPR